MRYLQTLKIFSIRRKGYYFKKVYSKKSDSMIKWNLSEKKKQVKMKAICFSKEKNLLGKKMFSQRK